MQLQATCVAARNGHPKINIVEDLIYNNKDVVHLTSEPKIV